MSGNVNPPNVINITQNHPGKPWVLNKEQLQKDKIDRLATQIMAGEALKIITEAYESVFEGKVKEKASEEENQNLEKHESGGKQKAW